MEALYQFLNAQSDGRLIIYALVFCAVVGSLIKMIVDIVRNLTRKQDDKENK